MALLQLDDIRPKARPRQAIEVTPSAVTKIKGMLQTRPELTGKGLRVYVATGGCAGYSYGMEFDHPATNDVLLDCDGLQVMVDPESFQWLRGVQVDYQETLVGSGFSIANPNAAASCGCGASFSKGDDAPTTDEESCH